LRISGRVKHRPSKLASSGQRSLLLSTIHPCSLPTQ
jgi:hypothetical protein